LKLDVEITKNEFNLPFAFRLRETGLTWNWHDWVLCHIAFRDTNPIHWCLAFDFRVGRDGDISCGLFNSTWEPVAQKRFELGKLYYFKPVRVLEEVREELPWAPPV
jgi:hypothetical protein